MCPESQFINMTSSSDLFDVVFFLLSSLVTDISFISIPSLVLELWQFQFIYIKDWPEIQKLEKNLSEFFPISRVWRLEQIRDVKFGTDACIKMLLNVQNTRVTVFNAFELLKEKQQGGKITPRPRPLLIPRLVLNYHLKEIICFIKFWIYLVTYIQKKNLSPNFFFSDRIFFFFFKKLHLSSTRQ